MGTISKLDENNGNLMGIPPPTPLKIRNIPWGHVGATQFALFTCFILRFFL
jgi:hypothetical protein